MLRDPSPQVNGLIDPTQPSTDPIDEHFVAKLRALYVAPEVPLHLRQAGAAQVRLQLADNKPRRARHDMFGLLRRLHAAPATLWSAATASAGPMLSERPGGHGHLERSPRLTTAAVAAVVLVSLLAVALFAWPAPFRYGLTTGPAPIAGHGKHTPAATPSLAISRLILTSIAMVSANDGWAFGGENFSGGACLVLHYNGIAWSRHPGSACIEATSIAMLSANEGWAVGYNTILHYTRGDWRVDTTYAPQVQSVQLENVVMVSPDEGWAVGSADAHAYVLHYAHGHWEQANVAGLTGDRASSLRGIAMVSAQEGWAAGSELSISGETTLVLHYSKGRWTRMAWSMTGSFNGVAAFPSGDVWVVGEDNPAAGPGLVVHLRQGNPIQEDRPAPGLLEDIAMLSPSEGWAVGGGAATVHYHNGVWTKEGLTIHQYALMRVSLVSATEGWAVGSSLVSPSRDPNASAILFHLSGGVWQVYPLSGV